MMHFPFRRLLATALMAATLLPVAAGAQSSSSSSSAASGTACLREVFQAMAKQQRLFRVTVLGRHHAQDVAESTVWYDGEGTPWMKTDENLWQTTDIEEPSLGDEDMDALVETDPTWDSPFRRGILETQTTLTSSLVPSLTQSIRALQCRLQAVCRTAQLSRGPLAPGSFAVGDNVEGCLPVETFEIPVMTSCLFSGESEIRDVPDVIAACMDVSNRLLDREIDTLRLLVAYDAATRTLYQFVGTIEHFIERFSLPLMWPLMDLSDLVDSLTQMPCFLSACEQ